MKKVKSIKLKPKSLKYLKLFGIIICIFLGIFLFYSKQIHDLEKIGYSKKASQKILFSFKKDYVLGVGENKTLNRAFESNDYNEKYLDNYSKINYYNQSYLIKNINKLIKIGYSNNDINIILAHGNDQSVTNFTKREKVKYLEEFFDVDYAKLDNYDRYLKYSDETGENEETVVLLVNLDMDKEYYKDSTLVEDFSTDMLVNKHRHLNEKFVPDNLVKIEAPYTLEKDLKCSKVALDAFKKMSKKAKEEGYEIVINSAYRSYQDQKEVEDLYLKSYGQEYVDKFVAKPGYSEHQTGLAFDVGSRKTNIFANSKEYDWMVSNCYKYGFIYRFQKKNEDITGFRSEPWHFRYVGEKIAKYIYENDMTLEEYWAIYLDK